MIDVTHTPPVDVQSNDNRVERNLIEESGGLEIIESDRNELIDNVVAARERQRRLARVRARQRRARQRPALQQERHRRSRARPATGSRRNDASDSESTGIALESQSFDNDLIAQQVQQQRRRRHLRRRRGARRGSGMLIEGNRTNNNKGYGIYVPKPSHVIKGNSANDNGSWGIYVSEGQQRPHQRRRAAATAPRATSARWTRSRCMPQQCYLVQCAGGPPIVGDPVAAGRRRSSRARRTRAPATPRCSASPAPTTSATSRSSARSTPTAVRARASRRLTLDGPRRAATHRFEVRAVDVSGNVDSTPATHTWTVGAQPGGQAPETTIDSGPDLTTVQHRRDVRVRRDERNATLRVPARQRPRSRRARGPACPACSAGTARLDHLHRPVGRHAHVPGARDRRRRQRRRDAGRLDAGASPPRRCRPTVGCGEFVTHSIALTNDLIDCPGHGLIVGANDITIDLDGHVIDGIGLDAGVLNNGYDSVTVTDGHIHEFDYGVQLNPGTSQNVVTGAAGREQPGGRHRASPTPTRTAWATRSATTRSPATATASASSAARATPSCATTRSAPTWTTPCTWSRRARTAITRQRDRPLRRRRRVHAGRRQQHASPTT